MKIKVISIGKSNPSFIEHGVDHFCKKISHFCTLEWKELSPKKKFEEKTAALTSEAEYILDQIETSDHVILLDERGLQFRTSHDFAEFLNKKQIASPKRIAFVIGGSYGFAEIVQKRAQEKISMAPMTYTHQMIRLIFLEQLYRGYAILHHLPFHHE